MDSVRELMAILPALILVATGLLAMLVDLFAWALRPRTHLPQLGSPFARPAGFHSHVPDTVLDLWLAPARFRAICQFGAR